MADEVPPSSSEYPTQEGQEKMECEDTPPDSEKAVVSPKSSSTTSGGVPSSVGTTSGPGSDKMECEDTPPDSEQAVVSPKSPSTASGGVPSNLGPTSGSGSDKLQLELPIQESVGSPERSPGPSDVTSPKSEGKTGVKQKGVVQRFWKATKKAVKRLSPRKSDKEAFVPEEACGEFAAGPSSAGKTSAATSSKSRGKKNKDRGDVELNSLPDEEMTEWTELSASSRQLFPDDPDRKESITSCDTGAHISMLPSLDESGAGNEPKETSDDEGESKQASTETPLDEEQ